MPAPNSNHHTYWHTRWHVGAFNGRFAGPVDDALGYGGRMAPTRPMILTFCVLSALFAAGYGVMITVLHAFRASYAFTGPALAVVVAMGFFSSFLAQVFLAPLADRGHARLLVYVGLLLNVAGLLSMAMAHSVVPMLLARFVMG